MLRWSIATVCMGGALEGKLAAAAKAGFRAIEMFENDLTFFSGKPRDAREMSSRPGARNRRAAAHARLRGDAGRDPRPQFRARRAEVRTDARAGRAASEPVLQCFGRGDRRSGTRRRRSCRTRRPGAPPRLYHRLRGAGLGAARPRLDRSMGSGEGRRSAQPRHRARQFPRLRARQSARSDERHPGGEDCAGAGRRCARPADGPAVA